MRNAVLFIPSVILLNHRWGLTGVIAAQPVVEVLLTVIGLILYTLELRAEHRTSPKDSFQEAQSQPRRRMPSFMHLYIWENTSFLL